MNSDRLMRNMLQSMGMGMPMNMFPDFGMLPGMQMQPNPINSMMPHGFMSPMSMMMMDPFQGMQQAMSMANSGNNGFSYCSSSVTSYTTDEQGRPQVYQQSSEVKQGPGGVKETKAAVRDSRTGHQELAIGHHLYDKAHVKKKSKNIYTGEEEQAEDFVNLDEAETETFEQDWMRHAKHITPSSYNQLQNGSRGSSSCQNDRLALTSAAHEDLVKSSSHRKSPYSSIKSAMKLKKKKKTKELRD